MAGFGAAHALYNQGVRGVVFEKKPHHGGHTASHRFPSGYVLDEGPHVSFTKNERIRRLFADSVEQEFEESPARVNNYWRGHWIDHPAQCHLHGLPQELVVDIIRDFADAAYGEVDSIENYEQWLRASLGHTFAENFPFQYTKKYHTTDAANLSTDWIGPRIYRPSMEEVLRGALSPAAANVHYITKFRYPRRGGYMSYLQKFVDQADLKLGHELVALDHHNKRLRFANGSIAEYDEVISSIPLPELIPLIVDAPADVREAARRLACSEVVIVSVGVARPDPHDAHWSYFYDEDIFFTRLSTPHLQSRHNVPPGCACLMAECYYSDKYRPLDRAPEDCIAPVIADLRRVGILHADEQPLFTNAMRLKYANVIFDLERRESLAVVHGFLDDIGVEYCGRYGLWAYIWTDQSFLSGEKAAERALGRVRSLV